MDKRLPGQDIAVILNGQHVKIPCNETVFKHLSNGKVTVCDASRCDIGDFMTLKSGHDVVRVA